MFPRTSCPLPGQDVPPLQSTSLTFQWWELGIGPENKAHAEDGIWPCYASIDWSHFQTAFLAPARKMRSGNRNGH